MRNMTGTCHWRPDCPSCHDGQNVRMRIKLIEDLPMASSAELYQLSWVIEQLLADPRRIVQARTELHTGEQVQYLHWDDGKMRAARVVAMKDCRRRTMRTEGRRPERWHRLRINERFALFASCSAEHDAKNWLFVGSQQAGERAAVVLSLIESAKLNGHDPWAYLKDVFERLPTLKQRDLAQLLPHNWRPSGNAAVAV